MSKGCWQKEKRDKYMARIMVLLFLCCSSNSFAWQESFGGSGDIANFKLKALEISEFVENKGLTQFQRIYLSKIKQDFFEIQISCKSQLMLAGAEVDAINYPYLKPKILELNCDKYNRYTEQFQYMLVTHELLHLYEVNDSKYRYSLEISKLFTDYSNFQQSLIQSSYGGWPLSCPSGYVPVPALPGYTDKGFCVAKYEMKNDLGAKSQPRSEPWVDISRDEAIEKCQSLGSGYDLISNAHWQTIARNIADVADNWGFAENGQISKFAYRGSLSQGISDSSRPHAQEASDSDEEGCFNTGQVCSKKTWNSQRRTHVLTNGSVVWDLAGNVSELLKDNNYNTQGKDGFIADMDVNHTGLSNLGNDLSCEYPSANNNCGFGFGVMNYKLGAIVRGGSWYSEWASGVFAVNLHITPQTSHYNIGFRCVFQP